MADDTTHWEEPPGYGEIWLDLLYFPVKLTTEALELLLSQED
jgi:hypothetical protein